MIEGSTLDHFYDCMKLEIGRLWQRSVFLATFLVLIFAGYGNVLLKLFDTKHSWCVECLCISLLNLVCVVISVFGILFSILWILMGKGSKAWQEKYERTLFLFVENVENWNSTVSGLAKHGITHGRLRGVEAERFDNGIFNFKAGAYSPSKINIMIGQISLFFWVIVGISHSTAYCYGAISSVRCSRRTWFLFFVVLVASILGLVVGITHCLRCSKSNLIQDKQNKEEAEKSNSHENK